MDSIAPAASGGSVKSGFALVKFTALMGLGDHLKSYSVAVPTPRSSPGAVHESVISPAVNVAS